MNIWIIKQSHLNCSVPEELQGKVAITQVETLQKLEAMLRKNPIPDCMVFEASLGIRIAEEVSKNGSTDNETMGILLREPWYSPKGLRYAQTVLKDIIDIAPETLEDSNIIDVILAQNNSQEEITSEPTDDPYVPPAVGIYVL